MRTTSLLGGFTLGLVLAFQVGCGKEEPAVEPAPIQPDPAAAAPAPAHQPAPAYQQQGQPAAPPIETVVFERTLAYAQGRIAQRDFQGARDALANIESQNLSAAQKSRLEALRRQIPQ